MPRPSITLVPKSSGPVAAAPELGFVHLHVHSSYSLLEGAMTVATIAKLAEADGQPALALTDTNNLFGALEFSEKLAGCGIQPITGVQLSVAFGDEEGQGRRLPPAAPHIVLLAADETGYRNLMRLVSRACLGAGGTGSPVARLDQIADAAEGLIALTGGPGGPVDGALRAGQGDLAAARLARLAAIFGDRLYVEIQRHGTEGGAAAENDLLRLAYAADLPLVATNEPFFATPGDFDAHDALLAVAEGGWSPTVTGAASRPRMVSPAGPRWPGRFADLPEALANTVEIARRCAFRPGLRKPILPRFGAESGLDEGAELRRQAGAGLAARFSAQPPAAGFSVADYEIRLAFELSVIESMRYPGYFLIVADFIQWAKGERIPVGTRPRLRRRLGRGLGPDHHRCRSAALRPAVRALPQSRPRLDAGFRHRFLPGPARGGDRLRQAPLRRGPRRPDHHLRHLAGARRAARCRTRAGNALWADRQADQARAAEPGQADLARRGDRGRAEAAECRGRGTGGGPPARDRPEAGGLHRHASTHAAGIVIGDRPLEELVALSVDPRTGMRVTQFT